MRESSWDECVEGDIVIKVSPDLMKMKSLMETANGRLKFLPDMTDENCNFVFEGYYTSLLELIQAIIAKKGYKILNHICVGYLLRNVLKREDLYLLFGNIRYRRKEQLCLLWKKDGRRDIYGIYISL